MKLKMRDIIQQNLMAQTLRRVFTFYRITAEGNGQTFSKSMKMILVK
jgi:hypothetical protein